MDNKDKRDLYFKVLLIIAIIIPVMISFSYAYFLTETNSGSTSVGGQATNSFNFYLDTTNDGYIDASNIIPITSEQVDQYANSGTFTVRTGVNDYNVSYSLYLTDMTIPDELKTEEFKWSITCTSCNDNSKDASGNFISVNNSEIRLSNNNIIASNSTDTYTIKIWLEENGGDQTSAMNKTFRAKVKAIGEFIQNS